MKAVTNNSMLSVEAISYKWIDRLPVIIIQIVAKGYASAGRTMP
jgi:hypothetical protein